MTIFAVLLAFGAGFMVRQLVDREQGWSYREFTMDPWARHRGFYPGSKPGSTAATFDEACTDLEYTVFLSKQTEADFQASRNQRDWTATKYVLRDPGHVPHITLEAANRLA